MKKEDLKLIEDYEKQISTTDKYNLDEEWLRQAGASRACSKLLAQARKRLSRAEEKKKTVRSELILQANQPGGDELLGVDKIKDTVVEAWYRTQDVYKEAVKEVIDAQYDVNMLEGLVSSCTDKKHSLQNLVTLYESDYWAEPKEPKGSNFKEKASKKSSERSRGELKKKYKKGEV